MCRCFALCYNRHRQDILTALVLQWYKSVSAMSGVYTIMYTVLLEYILRYGIITAQQRRCSGFQQSRANIVVEKAVKTLNLFFSGGLFDLCCPFSSRIVSSTGSMRQHLGAKMVGKTTYNIITHVVIST